MKEFFIVSLISLVSINSYAETCDTLINNLISYSQLPPKPTYCGGNSNYNAVEFRIATNRSDGRYVSYTEGHLVKTRGVVVGNPPKMYYFLKGDGISQFSDRFYDLSVDKPKPPESNPPIIVFPDMQNFTNKKQDTLGVSIYNNNLTLVLKSWGNGTFNVPVSCTTDNVMYGSKDGTFYTVSFKKVVLDVGCIPK